MENRWYAQSVPEVLAALGVSEHGLSAAAAEERKKKYGLNILPQTKAEGYPTLFLRQFQSPLIYLLLVAAAIVLYTGEKADALIIFAVLLFNAIVGASQEGKARDTLRALRSYVATTATVMRDGSEVIIPDTEVVPGDILVLAEGGKVPADARLIAVFSLKVDEASLTGESTPVRKTIDALRGEHRTTPQQHNMIFRGTNIVAGSGTAIVVATGVSTVVGGIAQEIAALGSEIPLKANIRHLSRFIIGIVGVICGTIFIIGLLTGKALATIFAIVVSLAVSIVPEGLPVALTLVLATGVWRMSKRNALVKNLQAVEALGQARVIAVDKTGTVTKNELVVREVWTPDTLFTIGGVGYEPKGDVAVRGSVVDAANHEDLLFAGKAAALSSGAHVSYDEAGKRWRVSGDPTEAALVVFGEKVGFRREDLVRETPLIAELPFDYALKYHAATYRTGNAATAVVAGAPEVLLALSVREHRGGHIRDLNDSEKAHLKSVAEHMSERGLRVLAYASQPSAPAALSSETLRDLVFGGFLGIQDALRGEVAGAMAAAEKAKIKVVMITGDHRLTARAIATEAGIFHTGDKILTGGDIDQLSDQELKRAIREVTVFARATPEHKSRIIRAFQERGDIIAMTGDGVNDAPSLVAADLGVAMGSIGTEVAKEAADIILLDDNFGTIVAAVEEGRSIYKTIQKVILYLFSTSIGEALVILGALLAGLPLPILAPQIIWLNFITDGFLDVALAMEPKEKGLLAGSFGRPKKYLVDSLMGIRMAVMAVPMAIGTLVLFSLYAGTDLEKAWTVTLTTLAVFQWMNAWNCRSSRDSLLSMNPFSNLYLIGATVIVISLQLAALYVPFVQTILHTVPLTGTEWAVIVAVASSILVAEELRKLIVRAWRAFALFPRPNERSVVGGNAS